MTLFRTWCVITFAAVSAYTAVTISLQGINLFPYFFGDILTMEWPGQFNFDFMFMLSLSAIWTVWRNQFTGRAYGLGVLAFFFGAPFLSAYLLYLSFTHEGDIKAMLLGAERAEATG